MEALLTFVWRFILELWPWTIIDKWELAFRTRSGKHLKELKPGIRVSLPFIDTVLTEPAKLQTANLTNQSVITLDRVNASVSGVTSYHVLSLLTVWMSVHDHEEAMSNLALAALAAELSEMNFADVRLVLLQRVVQRKIRSRAKVWGIHVDRFELTDLCDSSVYRVMGSDGNQTLVLSAEE